MFGCRVICSWKSPSLHSARRQQPKSAWKYLSNHTCYDKIVCTILFSPRWWVYWVYIWYHSNVQLIWVKLCKKCIYNYNAWLLFFMYVTKMAYLFILSSFHQPNATKTSQNLTYVHVLHAHAKERYSYHFFSSGWLFVVLWRVWYIVLLPQIMCSDCLERHRNCVFLCGHGACQLCADKMIECPICSKVIAKKIITYDWMLYHLLWLNYTNLLNVFIL